MNDNVMRLQMTPEQMADEIVKLRASIREHCRRSGPCGLCGSNATHVHRSEDECPLYQYTENGVAAAKRLEAEVKRIKSFANPAPLIKAMDAAHEATGDSKLKFGPPKAL